MSLAACRSTPTREASVKPGPFEYTAPDSLEEALSLLEQHGADAKILAGGQSLVPLMLGEPAAERWIFAESADAVAVRSNTHKLIRFHDGHLEFYDLGTDPGEQTPRTAACVDLCGQMAEQLVGHQRAMSELRQSGQGGETAILDEEELEELRSLGYL